MSNRFAELDPDEILADTSVSRKKAEKKLREIDSLKKKKGELTKEEIEKVASEQYWQRIVSPLPSTGEEKKANPKQKRTKAARKKKEADERENQRQEYQKREYQKREEHQNQQQRKRSFDEMQSNTKSKLDYMFVLGEFHALNRTHQNIDKVFRLLSIKYHPDKNIGRDEWATAMQQHLVNVRDNLLAQSL
jgi:hypothetical protein